MGFGFGRARRAAANAERESGETPAAPVSFRRLMGYARPYIPHLIVALVALAFTTAIDLAFPYVIKTLLDSVLSQRDYGLLNQIALALVVIFVLRMLPANAQNYLMAFVGEHIVMDIRNEVYEHLHQLSLRFFAERRVGELVSRLASDATLIRSVLTTNIATVIGQGLTFIGAVVIVVLINWRMTLFILALAPPVGLITAVFGRRLRKISTAVQDRLAESSTIVDEALQGVRVVKSFAREDYEVTRYKGVMQATFDTAMRLTRVRAA